MPLKYVFPCTGRSGSKYVQALITSCGLKCGHEDVYRIRNILPEGEEYSTSWAFTRDPSEHSDRFEAESSFVLAPYLNDPPCRQAFVCHVVRHPLRVVDSWRNQQGMGSFLFMGQFCPFTTHDPVSFMAGMYVAWNRFIAAQRWHSDRPWLRSKVEDMEHTLSLLGLSQIVAPGESAPPPIPKNINSIGSVPTTKVGDIRDKHIRRAFVEIANEYGYELE